MRTVLAILTRPPEAGTNALLEAQTALPETTLIQFDLQAPRPDYDELLRLVFAADSVQVF